MSYLMFVIYIFLVILFGYYILVIIGEKYFVIFKFIRYYFLRKLIICKVLLGVWVIFVGFVLIFFVWWKFFFLII